MSFPSLRAAAVFLTRPLVLSGTHAASSVQDLQLFLHTTLLTTPALSGTSATPQSPTKLVFAPNASPPLPIHLACLASGIAWPDWFRALGGSAFTLIIEPTITYVVRTDNGNVGVIWAADPSALSKTVEDEILDSDSESVSNSASSRPSSRGSHYSTFSFSSHSSASSNTSYSSTQSKGQAFSSSHPPIVPKSNPKRTALTPPPATTSTTKYLYQGGVSTILTGGVMLGSSSAARPTPNTARSPLHVHPFPLASRFSQSSAPTSTRPIHATYTPPHRTRAPQNTGSPRRPGGAPCVTGSWRRVQATTAI